MTGPRIIFLVFFAALALGSFFFSRDYVYRGAPDSAAWRDLRVWSFLLMIILMGIYTVF